MLQAFGADEVTIANVEAALQGTASPTTLPTTGISDIPAGFQFTKLLKQGDTDQEVVYLKIVLAAEACVSGLSNTFYFGSQTKAGVQCFQNKYKAEISQFAGYSIKGTGFLGTGTRTQLNKLLDKIRRREGSE